jgi:hypothetical protein
MSCNRAISATEENNADELRKHLNSLLQAVRKMTDVFENDDAKKLLNGFEAAIESHMAQI